MQPRASDGSKRDPKRHVSTSLIANDGSTRFDFLCKGHFVALCGCGREVDIRALQSEIKLARQFYERARSIMDTSEGSDMEQAVKALNHSLSLRVKYLHPMHQELGKTHDALAEALARLGRYQEAAKHLECAVKVLEAIFSPYSFEMADQFFKLAQLHFNTADTRKAEEWAERAQRVWSLLTGTSPGRASQGAERGQLRGARILEELQQIQTALQQRKTG